MGGVSGRDIDCEPRRRDISKLRCRQSGAVSPLDQKLRGFEARVAVRATLARFDFLGRLLRIPAALLPPNTHSH